MNSQAVIGCGFGDEGKGMTTSYLCSQSSAPLVVRFSGGHQAGHNVILNENLFHVFSNFGSGTLQGHHTYWSKYCTIDPMGILNELDILNQKNINPILFIDERCPITTPYEKRYNKFMDGINKHGSCGVGFGQTFQREEDHYSLLYSDLFYPSILEMKMGLIKKYYEFVVSEDEIHLFLKDCYDLTHSKNIEITYNMPQNCYDNYIFEGSQGLLLDQNYGFFPHVSRTNTGSQNILDMGFEPEMFLVTRAYQTRHGNGLMTNEKLISPIDSNPYEHNRSDNFQGKFRTTLLDLNLLKYAINKDHIIRENEKNLVITCFDVMRSPYKLTINGKIYSFVRKDDFVDKIKLYLKIDNIFTSDNPYSTLGKYENDIPCPGTQ